tara:strand:+ start:5501 stop:5806 length:306 start_codon:yes stop_codon:yes gene_type:complete
MTTSYILERQAELRKNKALMRAAERAEAEMVAEKKRLGQAADVARLEGKLNTFKNSSVSVTIQAPDPVIPKTFEKNRETKPKAKISFKKKPVSQETDDASK